MSVSHSKGELSVQYEICISIEIMNPNFVSSQSLNGFHSIYKTFISKYDSKITTKHHDDVCDVLEISSQVCKVLNLISISIDTCLEDFFMNKFPFLYSDDEPRVNKNLN
jgi:hypothetical protein